MSEDEWAWHAPSASLEGVPGRLELVYPLLEVLVGRLELFDPGKGLSVLESAEKKNAVLTWGVESQTTKAP